MAIAGHRASSLSPLKYFYIILASWLKKKKKKISSSQLLENNPPPTYLPQYSKAYSSSYLSFLKLNSSVSPTYNPQDKMSHFLVPFTCKPFAFPPKISFPTKDVSSWSFP